MNLRISYLLATAALSMPAFAQNVLFSENFSAGIPATWTHQTLGSPVDVWMPGVDPVTLDPDVFHEWFCFSGFHFRNNILVTPRIDLTGLAQVYAPRDLPRTGKFRYDLLYQRRANLCLDLMLIARSFAITAGGRWETRR